MEKKDEKYLENCRVVIEQGDRPYNGRILYFLCAEYIEIRNTGDSCVVMVYPYDWSHFMTPWIYSGNTMKNTGGGIEFADSVYREIAEFAEKERTVRRRGIAGYSLGGLESLFMSYNMNDFCFTGTVSGSLWYPGALQYFTTNKISEKIGHVYMSLGDKECVTHNNERSMVMNNTKEIRETISLDTTVTWELMKGGHFTDVGGRINNCIQCFNNMIL